MPNNELFEIIGPALIAGLMISLTHAPLGIQVLKRGIIFIDLAVAQISGLCLIGASLWLFEPPWWLKQSIALSGAILAALAFRLIERRIPKQQEAIIGSCFVIAACLALILLAEHPHGGEELQHLLSGQILFVTWLDILSHAPIYLFVLTIWFSKASRYRNGLSFYLLFSLAITSSVQLVGVYVVFASLILPALAAINTKRKHVTAWICGLLSVNTGMFVATLFDLLTGPLIVVCYGLFCIVLVSFHKFRKLYHNKR